MYGVRIYGGGVYGDWSGGASSQRYSKGAYASLPLNDDDLTTLFATQDYTDVESENSVFVLQSFTNAYSVFLFKDKGVSYYPFFMTCKLQSKVAPSSSEVFLQIYNRNTSTWETIDSDNSTNADTTFTLTSSIITDLTKYYDAQLWLAHRVYQHN